MLSILIPVYNYDIRVLVEGLLAQARRLEIPFEIIIEDDASDNRFRETNSALAEFPEITMVYNATNRGRSRVRNHLADLAHYPYLLFVDCDAGICHDDYLKSYCQFISSHSKSRDFPFAVLGGVAYRETAEDSKTSLRLHYGRAREIKSANERKKNPYHAFTPFNMLISKSVFSICRFDESFKSYGFEDMFFATALKRQNVPVYHIDNVLYHDGLDGNEQYLRKVETAIQNLARLWHEQRLTDFDIRNSKLLTAYNRCKRCHITGLVRLGFVTAASRLRHRVLHHNSLFSLDLYKLGYLCEALTKNHGENKDEVKKIN